MHIPVCTDEMIDAVVKAAASPVLLIFFSAGDRISIGTLKRTELVADKYDDRVIFLAVNLDENPSLRLPYSVFVGGLVLMKLGREVGRIGELGQFTWNAIADLIELGLTKTQEL
jgi:hypothetical protein